jgi:hypothetical protein
MLSIEYRHDSAEGYVTELLDTGTQVAELVGHIPYRQFRVSATDAQLTADSADTEEITVELVTGLQVARGETPADALAYDGDVTLTIDGAEIIKTMTDGSVSFDISTSKPAGVSVTVQAVGIPEHPTKSDSVSIEVI